MKNPHQSRPKQIQQVKDKDILDASSKLASMIVLQDHWRKNLF